MPHRYLEWRFTPKKLKVNRPKMRFQLKLMKVIMKVKCASEGRRIGFWGAKVESNYEGG